MRTNRTQKLLKRGFLPFLILSQRRLQLVRAKSSSHDHLTLYSSIRIHAFGIQTEVIIYGSGCTIMKLLSTFSCMRKTFTTYVKRIWSVHMQIERKSSQHWNEIIAIWIVSGVCGCWAFAHSKKSNLFIAFKKFWNIVGQHFSYSEKIQFIQNECVPSSEFAANQSIVLTSMKTHR